EGWIRAFLAELKDEDLDRLVEYKNPRGEARSMALGELLQHGANHGVHHRGQVALLLRVLGHVPGNVDLLFYDAERHHVSAF
ncbi:MAG TPA: DinB family protein, partial [Vicinamibacterales bacterium]